MLEEEIKRLTAAVLDLTAVLKDFDLAKPPLVCAQPLDLAAIAAMGPGSVFSTPAPSPAAAKAYADVATVADAHAEAIAPYVTPACTADDARKALMKVAAAKGKDAAAAVLKQFSAAKVTELAPQHWPEFIAACEGAL